MFVGVTCGSKFEFLNIRSSLKNHNSQSSLSHTVQAGHNYHIPYKLISVLFEGTTTIALKDYYLSQSGENEHFLERSFGFAGHESRVGGSVFLLNFVLVLYN